MKSVGYVFVVGFLMLISVNFAHAGVYDAFKVLPASASNTLIQNLMVGYDTLDYDLFEVCAQRCLELELEGSLPYFVEIYESTDPTINNDNPVLEAELVNYFHVSILALGYFGGDYEAGLLHATLVSLQDDYVAYYIIKALGFMVGNDIALSALNGAADWVDNQTLGLELLNSIVEHNDVSSIGALNVLYNNTALRGIRDQISDAITVIASG